MMTKGVTTLSKQKDRSWMGMNVTYDKSLFATKSSKSVPDPVSTLPGLRSTLEHFGLTNISPLVTDYITRSDHRGVRPRGLRQYGHGIRREIPMTMLLDLTRGDTPSRQFGFVVAGANQTSARLWSREIRDGMLVRNVGIR